MKDILLSIVRAIVDHPDDVVIDEQMQNDMLTLVIHVHADDMGQIIGKSGRTIRSIRDLIKIAATKQNVYVDVTLFEQQPRPTD